MESNVFMFFLLVSRSFVLRRRGERDLSRGALGGRYRRWRSPRDEILFKYAHRLFIFTYNIDYFFSSSLGISLSYKSGTLTDRAFYVALEPAPRLERHQKDVDSTESKLRPSLKPN